MIDDLIVRILDKHELIMDLVDELFDVSPPRPKIVRQTYVKEVDEELYNELFENPQEPHIVFGNCDIIGAGGIIDPKEIFGERQTHEGVPVGTYYATDKLIVIDPQQMIRQSKGMKQNSINVHPAYEIERVLTKEYAQYIQHSFHGDGLIDMTDESTGLSLAGNNFTRYMFIRAYIEACGLVAMPHVAKQLSHRDEYRRQVDHTMYAFALQFSSLPTKFKDYPTTLIGAVAMHWAYDIADQVSNLGLEDLRKWVRRNPLEFDAKEVQNSHNTFMSRISQYAKN